jgi:D-aminopeptidase
MRGRIIATLFACVAAVSAHSQPSARPRARDLGIAPGALTPGPLNAITDVAGVRVGQTTIIQGDTVRTGVTAILPYPGNLFQDKVAGAVFVGNAFGKRDVAPLFKKKSTASTTTQQEKQ